MRRKRIDKLMKSTGQQYHQHYWEIVVSENELSFFNEKETWRTCLNNLFAGKDVHYNLNEMIRMIRTHSAKSVTYNAFDKVESIYE